MSCSLTSQTRLFILSLLLQIVRADVECHYDGFGDEVCKETFVIGGRIGAGVGITVGVLLIIFGIAYARRRKIQKNNLSYINNPNQGQNNPQQTQNQDGSGNQYQQTGYQPGYGGQIQSGVYPPNSGQHLGINTPSGGHPSYAPPPDIPLKQ